ncbi:MAG: hypothetical protein JWO37_2826 [Acidimicrobiales bacterium]|jgi:ABC-type branched-subunit amino acid transport system substrate-binding protein|nr:hypothetical protein [Acidimicrobiales bacterium]
MRVRVALIALAVATSGCGLRVSPSRLAAARQGNSIVAGPGAPTAESNTAGAGSTASGDQATNGGIAGSAVQSVATPGAGAAPNASSADNGGATDTGVTATEIRLGNVVTLSGPVPGLFQGAAVGTQAAVAYLNSLGGINGRTFKVDIRDDQFDTGQNRAQTIDLMSKVFAFAGSFSVYDDAAVNEVKSSGIVDTTYSLSEARRKISNNFSVSPGYTGWRLGPLNHFKQQFAIAYTTVGTLYGDVPASKTSYVGWKQAAESVGYKILYERGYQPTETDFTADVIRMRQSGVKMIYIMATDVKTQARLAKTMQQQNFKVDAFISGGTTYDPSVFTLGGPAVNGIINEQQMAMYIGEDASVIPEVALFNKWLTAVKPGYKPDLFAVFAWSETRLLAQAIQAAGPKLTRAGVIDALRRLGTFDDHGMLAPANPGTKTPPTCYLMLRLVDGKFERYDTPAPGFRCGEGGFFYGK